MHYAITHNRQRRRKMFKTVSNFAITVRKLPALADLSGFLSKMVLTPRESGKFVAENAKNVKIKEEGIKKLGEEIAKQINSGELTVDRFSQKDVHPSCEESWALDWIFVVDALNFCFWKPTGEIGWTVDGYTGYFALCAAINRAMKENIDIVNPKFYATITEEQLKKILRSDTDVQIPLFPERIKVLHEVGSCLLENFEGSFENVVKQSGNSAVKLLNLIVDNFKCFRDEATYKDEKVAIYKRAQILVGDIWACHKNQGIGHFKDIEEITMFADYRVPQSLLYYGVFEYSDKLNEKLKKNQIFNNGDEDEVEIRACSIRAVDQLVDYAKGKIDKDKNINAILVDHFLWDFRRAHAKEIAEKALPFHLTLSIYY